MYCVSIERIINILFSRIDIVLCRETAAAFLGLSNGWGLPFQFYYENNCSMNISNNKDNTNSLNTLVINSAYIHGYPSDSLKTISTTQIGNILCTDEEQTICELIIYNCDFQTIIESISNYYYNHNENFTLLYNRANELGIKEQIEGYTEDAIEYYND